MMLNTSIISHIFNEGQQAFGDHYRLRDNPYRDEQERLSWEAGWRQGSRLFNLKYNTCGAF